MRIAADLGAKRQPKWLPVHRPHRVPCCHFWEVPMDLGALLILVIVPLLIIAAAIAYIPACFGFKYRIHPLAAAIARRLLRPARLARRLMAKLRRK